MLTGCLMPNFACLPMPIRSRTTVGPRPAGRKRCEPSLRINSQTGCQAAADLARLAQGALRPEVKVALVSRCALEFPITISRFRTFHSIGGRSLSCIRLVVANASLSRVCGKSER